MHGQVPGWIDKAIPCHKFKIVVVFSTTKTIIMWTLDRGCFKWIASRSMLSDFHHYLNSCSCEVTRFRVTNLKLLWLSVPDNRNSYYVDFALSLDRSNRLMLSGQISPLLSWAPTVVSEVKSSFFPYETDFARPDELGKRTWKGNCKQNMTLKFLKLSPLLGG